MIVIPSLLMAAAIVALVWFMKFLGERGHEPHVTNEKTLFRRGEEDE
jgi:hypothetical protein